MRVMISQSLNKYLRAYSIMLDTGNTEISNWRMDSSMVYRRGRLVNYSQRDHYNVEEGTICAIAVYRRASENVTKNLLNKVPEKYIMNSNAVQK